MTILEREFDPQERPANRALFPGRWKEPHARVERRSEPGSAPRIGRIEPRVGLLGLQSYPQTRKRKNRGREPECSRQFAPPLGHQAQGDRADGIAGVAPVAIDPERALRPTRTPAGASMIG